MLSPAANALLAPVAAIDGFRLASLVDAATGMVVLMSQGAIAAGRLAASVRPGRAADGYGNVIAARLRRLAGAGRTGVLPFGGQTEGALYFTDGRVVFAASAGTPGPVIGAQPDEAAAPAALAAAEPIADAALDLVQSKSSPSRFRSARVPPTGPTDGFAVESVLAEVARPGRGVLPMSFLRAVSTQNGGVR